jgi:hypothetical protein
MPWFVKNLGNDRTAASNAIWAVVAVIIIMAGAGAYVYYTNYSGGTTPSFRTGTTVASNVILTGQTSGGFYKGQIVSFAYSQYYQCLPALSKFATNQTEANAASAKTTCEVGGGNATALPNALPVFILIPVYAGLSIFGVPALGAASQGYPVFNNNLVFTQCGAGGSTSACFDHPTLLYSPFFTAVEQHLGINTGTAGFLRGSYPPRRTATWWTTLEVRASHGTLSPSWSLTLT